eukprot:Nitzschia sp. Nitz4//scaffold118_size93875//18775//19602//NITZ4_004778-RA/size93875-processed-gene-0.55-mRNA-1//-1//CDS//3329533694//1327//frame0
MNQGYLPKVVWAISIAAAVAFIPLSTQERSTAVRSVIKTIPLVGFTTIASYHRLPVALILALSFSAGGDLALSRPGDTAFLIGLISFALGHVCYIVLFSRIVQRYARWTLPPFVGLAVSTEFWLAPHTDDMKWPVRVYVIIICVMSISAVNLPQESVLRLATLGALSFLASDLLLSLVLFRFSEASKQSEIAEYALWTLYVMGQAFILMAFLQHQYLTASPQTTTAVDNTVMETTSKQLRQEVVDSSSQQQDDDNDLDKKGNDDTVGAKTSSSSS